MIQRINKPRLEWVDLYKFFGIMLVVLGHTTPLFNAWIYQFHMAAFFFISGYTSSSQNKSFGKLLIQKFYSYILPIFSIFFIFMAVNYLFYQLNIYDFMVGYPWVGLRESVKQLFLYGNNYTYWMGATWFIVALFGIELLNKVFLVITDNRQYEAYYLLSFLVFIFAYYYVNSDFRRNILFLQIPQILIGQFFFCSGVIAKKTDIFTKLSSKQHVKWIVMGFTIGIMQVIKAANWGTVDYPPNSYMTPIRHIICGYNGILFCFSFSSILGSLPKAAKSALLYIGKNTMGIVVFHFFFMKVSRLILYVLRIIPYEAAIPFIPSGENYSWIFNTVFSMAASVGLWVLLLKIPFMYFLLGHDRALIERSTLLCSNIYQNSPLGKLSVRMKKQLIQSVKHFCCAIKTKLLQLSALSKRSLIIYLLTMFIVMIVGITLATPFIMYNEELIGRLHSLKGLRSFFSYYMANPMNSGYALNPVFASFSMVFEFIGAKYNLHRVLSMLIILGDIIAFCVLLYRVFSNRNFSIFVGVFLFSFLPITYENIPPNAFISLLGIPLFTLFLSLVLYVNALQQKSRAKWIIAMLLWGFTLLLHNSFIMLLPLYFVLPLISIPDQKRSLKNTLKSCRLPILIAFLYLVFGFISHIIHPSDYSLVFSSPKDSLLTLWQLMKSSFPGYYLSNAKNIQLIDMLKSSTWWEDITPSLILLVVYLPILLYLLFSRHANSTNKLSFKGRPFAASVSIVLLSCACILLPLIYGCFMESSFVYIGESSMVSSPLSYVSFFFAAFTICFLIWKIVSNINTKVMFIVASCFVSLMAFQVQSMNTMIVKEQQGNYLNLQLIERALETNVFNSTSSLKTDSSKIGLQNNTLTLSPEYWNDYASTHNVSAQFVANDPEAEWELYFIAEDILAFTNQQTYYLFSSHNIDGRNLSIFSPDDNHLFEFTLGNGSLDHSLYVYTYSPNANEQLPASQNPKTPSVGTTSDQAYKEKGFFDDGWVSKEVTFYIQTGSNGIITLQGYTPDLVDQMQLDISVNETRSSSYLISSNTFEIVINAFTDEFCRVDILCSYEKQASASDDRMVSYLITDISAD